jgi:uncharacterized membrane protein
MITSNEVVNEEPNVHQKELRKSADIWGAGVALFVIGIAALVLGFLLPWLIVMGVVLLVLSLIIMNYGMKRYNRARNSLRKREAA